MQTVNWPEPIADILQGDVMERLKELPDDKFDCVVTSPPYWGQRDYQFDGQIGLEPTLGEHIDKLVEVFREVRRVLKPTGTLWLNYGDNFAGAVNGRSAEDTAAPGKDDRKHVDKPMTGVGDGIKEKDLIGAPWTLALALRADGWYLRQCAIWSKPNPKPESVRDRPATSHEYVFMLTKEPRYYFDMEAVKEPASGQKSGNKNRSDPRDRGAPENGPASRGNMSTAVPWPGSSTRNLRSVWRSDEQTIVLLDGSIPNDDLPSVWSINVQPFAGAHFATFPERLVETCILASTSDGGVCATCGLPAYRVIEKGEPDREHQKACGGDENGAYAGEATKDYAGAKAENASDLKRRILEGMVTRRTVGWRRRCDCAPYPNVRPAVLDPFGGAGTVALVANRLGRDAVLIEAKEEYVEIAIRRLSPVPGEIVMAPSDEGAGECEQDNETTTNRETSAPATTRSKGARKRPSASRASRRVQPAKRAQRKVKLQKKAGNRNSRGNNRRPIAKRKVR